MMPSLAVCIATHERARLLEGTLAVLAQQTRPADELVIADSSHESRADALLERLRVLHPQCRLLAVRAATRALPELRWLAFTHTRADLVLFLDDDVHLAPGALAAIEAAYAERGPGLERLAAVGLNKWYDDGSHPMRARASWRERWLGTAGLGSGRMTDGGLTVSHAGLPTSGTAVVEHLWGGAMSYRRDVLLGIGRLDRLAELYRCGIGRGEDAVLSRSAAAFGPLVLLLDPFAVHPRELPSECTPYACSGWRLGLTATWGRAHTLRWVARTRRAYRRDWVRLAALELARSGGAIAQRPWALVRWQRLAGVIAGIGRATMSWRRIPEQPRSSAAAAREAPTVATARPTGAPR